MNCVEHFKSLGGYAETLEMFGLKNFRLWDCVRLFIRDNGKKRSVRSCREIKKGRKVTKEVFWMEVDEGDIWNRRYFENFERLQSERKEKCMN